MESKLLSINEVAEMLDISVQTVRNWEKKGVLASFKTAGGHRRFNEESIINFRNRNFAIASDEGFEEVYRREENIKRILQEVKAKACGGFSKEDMAILTHNQLLCKDESNRNYTDSLLYEIAQYLSSPYFFVTKAIFNCCDIFWYKRYRYSDNGCRVVIEGENVFANSWKIESYGDDIKAFKDLCNLIDECNIDNIVANSNPQKITKDKLAKEINSELLRKHYNGESNVFVLIPPELNIFNLDSKKLNENTREAKIAVSSNLFHCYVSRLIKPNTVIVGNKDENNCGYVFCPYILATKYNNNFKSRAASKLLREGAQYYTVFQCDD